MENVIDWLRERIGEKWSKTGIRVLVVAGILIATTKMGILEAYTQAQAIVELVSTAGIGAALTMIAKKDA